jgi:hypothetical protein
MVENARQIASKPLMPSANSDSAQAAVMPQYTSHSERAVCRMRGASLASFTGPGVSARYSCMPPTPSSGRIATANTMMPMPPSQCSEARHSVSACGRLSRPLMTVAPVVVRPDIASKYASVKSRYGACSISGSAATAVQPRPPIVTSRKPSRGLSSYRR